MVPKWCPDVKNKVVKRKTATITRYKKSLCLQGFSQITYKKICGNTGRFWLFHDPRNAVYVMYLGFESLTLRQNEKQVARPAFCFGKTKRGIRTRREQTCLLKKTVRWTVFADVVKERSDAKVHGSAPKKSLTLRQNEKQVARPAFCFDKTKRVFEQGGSRRSLRKKTCTTVPQIVKTHSLAAVILNKFRKLTC